MREMQDKLRHNQNVKSLVLKTERYTDIVDAKMDLSDTEMSGVKTKSKAELHREIVNEEMGTNGSTNLDVMTLSKGGDYIHRVNGETIPCAATHDVKSSVSEKNRNQKTTHDVKSSVSHKNNNQKSNLLKSTAGENVNSQIAREEMKTSTDVMHSGGDANSDSLKKRKKRKAKNKKLAVGVILNIETVNSGPSMQSHQYAGKQMDANIARSLFEKLTIVNNHEVQLMKTNGATSRKALLILDVNGLLADVVNPPPKDRKSDKSILKRAIFKRPFLDDFLGFCFKRFDVAIWSSRTRKVLDPVVDYLLGDLKKKLFFIWDSSHCTNSSARCLENKYKFIVFKEMRKIWEENDHDESNTLLLDDSPYKALLNPKHTGIFPLSYSYKHMNDNFLGPNGDLRVYLEGVATAENVKMYVEQHPFGQPAIDETNPQWAFYSKVLKNVS